MRVLGIETSCDETAAAIVEDGVRILSNVVSSQIDLHARFGGVVPEVASRAHVERINGCIQEAVDEAGVSWASIDGVAVTNRPGLVGSLLVGVCAAKAYAFVHSKPLVAVHHTLGHIYAAFLSEQPEFPFLALVASGGHSDLVLMREHGRCELLGATRDDAAGEAFDKVARLLGLPHPGGPNIDQVAAACPDEGERFPVADLGDSLDYSFSGLKTAVARRVAELGEQLAPADVGRVAKGLQDAVVRALLANVVRAVRRHGLHRVVLGGGVAANSRLREALMEAGSREGFAPTVPPMSLCTDNAAMVASAGHFALAAGVRDGLDIDVLACAPLPRG